MDWQRRLKSPLIFRSLVVCLSAITLITSACGSREPTGEVVFEPPSTPVAQPEQGPERASIYERDGSLREGDVVVAGLRLPRGIESKLQLGRRHVYEIRVPIDKVHRYFNAHLAPGRITRVGEGARYRSAVPRDATGALVKLDISIVPAGEGLIDIDIYELPPPPPRALTEAEMRIIVEREERERRLAE